MQLVQSVAEHQANHDQQGTVRDGFAELFVDMEYCKGREGRGR